MEQESKLEKRSRYCKHCKDNYWNHGDCESIKENGACVFCYKELKEEEKE